MQRTVTLLALLAASLTAAPLNSVRETAREIPLAHTVDVIVVGGGTGAVASAVAAAQSGAKTFLVALRPYLGEDMCAKTRLWMGDDETAATDLAKQIFGGAKTPVRPMHVKKTLDDALVNAGVKFLVSSYATDLLRDPSGRIAGLVIANRAGREAIRARVIIDATERAVVARLAGAQFRPFPARKYTFTRFAVGGQAKDGVKMKPTGKIFRGDGTIKEQQDATVAPIEIVEYTLDIAMRDGSFASFAKAEQQARTLTVTAAERVNTEELLFIAPDSMRARKASAGAWKGAAALPLEALQPAGVAGIYVLGQLADVSREQASKLMLPTEFMALGERVGKAAADDAKKATEAATVSVAARGAVPSSSVPEVKEILAGDRPAARGLAKVKSPARSVPVLASYDVVVVGGGTGGAPAAIAAARSGAKTLVIEYLHGLGGVGTFGLISSYYWGFRGGFTKEIPGKGDLGTPDTKTLMAGGAARKNSPGFRWDPLERAEWYRREIEKAGGEIWFGVAGCGAVVSGNKVTGVMVATEQGRGAVLGKVIIDSTGNADVAAAAGAKTVQTDSSELAQQGVGLPFVKIGAGYTNTDFTLTDETDMTDVSHLFVYAKERYADQFDLGQLIDSRERRRIVGDFELNLLDSLNDRSYPDTIAVAWSNFDTHGYTVDPYLLVDHPEKVGVALKVPYRCMLPKGFDGILVTGLGMSVHRDAVPLVRMQPDIQNQGYAAGVAAARIAKTGTTTRGIDMPALQKELAVKDIVPPTVVGEKDNFPLSADKVKDAIDQLKKDSKAARVIMAQPETASPLLRKAYAAALDPKDKLTYAMILAVLGDNSGVDTLIAALDATGWDKGWQYTGMGQFGGSLSRVDGWIVALGRTRDRRALPAILRKMAQLDANSEFSHHRAVGLALEMIADPSAAPAISALLDKPEMRGYVVKDTKFAKELSGMNRNDTRARAVSLRELSLGRALYRCGDYNGKGKAILEDYTNDLRGHWSRHARAVLEDIRQGAPK